jgi:hypothetical protein
MRNFLEFSFYGLTLHLITFGWVVDIWLFDFKFIIAVCY